MGHETPIRLTKKGVNGRGGERGWRWGGREGGRWCPGFRVEGRITKGRERERKGKEGKGREWGVSWESCQERLVHNFLSKWKVW